MALTVTLLRSWWSSALHRTRGVVHTLRSAARVVRPYVLTVTTAGPTCPLCTAATSVHTTPCLFARDLVCMLLHRAVCCPVATTSLHFVVKSCDLAHLCSSVSQCAFLCSPACLSLTFGGWVGFVVGSPVVLWCPLVSSLPWSSTVAIS